MTRAAWAWISAWGSNRVPAYAGDDPVLLHKIDAVLRPVRDLAVVRELLGPHRADDSIQLMVDTGQHIRRLLLREVGVIVQVVVPAVQRHPQQECLSVVLVPILVHRSQHHRRLFSGHRLLAAESVLRQPRHEPQPIGLQHLRVLGVPEGILLRHLRQLPAHSLHTASRIQGSKFRPCHLRPQVLSLQALRHQLQSDGGLHPLHRPLIHGLACKYRRRGDWRGRQSGPPGPRSAVRTTIFFSSGPLPSSCRAPRRGGPFPSPSYP